MTRIFFGGAALLALTACTTPIPDSGPGVGFDDYGSYQAERAQRDAALEGSAPVDSSTLPPAGRDSSDPAVAAATSVLDGPGRGRAAAHRRRHSGTAVGDRFCRAFGREQL